MLFLDVNWHQHVSQTHNLSYYHNTEHQEIPRQKLDLSSECSLSLNEAGPWQYFKMMSQFLRNAELQLQRTCCPESTEKNTLSTTMRLDSGQISALLVFSCHND